MTITFSGKQLPYFVKVEDIKFSLLPSLENKTMKMQGRPGVLDFGQAIGSREITIAFNFETPTRQSVMDYATQLAEWLFYEDLQPLIIKDEPDKIYYARVSGETDIEKIINFGRGSITFFCPSPYKESNVIKEATVLANSTTFAHAFAVNNEGSTDTYPIIEMTFNEEVTTAVVTTDDKQFFQIGTDVNVGDVATESMKDIIRDIGTTPSTWTTPVNVSGELTKNIVSDGWRYHIENWDYGPETEQNKWKWRGCGGLRSFEHDFYAFVFEGYFTMKCKDQDELGKVEFYLLDANNERICRAGLYNDNLTRNEPYFWVEVGGQQKVWKVPGVRDVWANFEGLIRISRSLTGWWSFYIAEHDWNTGEEHSGSYTEMYIGDDNPAHLLKLAKVQFYLGVSGAKPVYEMSVNDVFVKERLSLFPEGHIPYLPISPGETIVIDSEYGIISRDGMEMYEDLNPYSDFIKLRKGLNKLAITPASADVKIRYRERWL